jgi:UDP-N-acetylmuramate dehydrogenase
MALSAAMLADLERLVPGGIFTSVSLAGISRWKIGGIADVIIRPESPEQVQALRRYFYQNNVHHIAIGMTSNLLFADEGLRVPCIQIGSRMGKIDICDGLVQAQAGIWVPGLARKIQKAGLIGAEHICGIPGTIGGLICMNGGSQRNGIGSSVLQVKSVDELGDLIVREAIDCKFG